MIFQEEIQERLCVNQLRDKKQQPLQESENGLGDYFRYICIHIFNYGKKKYETIIKYRYVYSFLLTTLYDLLYNVEPILQNSTLILRHDDLFEFY